MLRLPGNWGGTVELATGIDQLEGVQEPSTLVALIAAGVVVGALGAYSLHKSIGKESLVLLAIRLCGSALLKETIIPELHEDLLHNLGLLLGRGAAEVVKANLEPVVHFFVLGVELIAKLLGCLTSLEGLGLCRSSVFVRAADIDGWPITKLAESRVDVGAQHTAHNIP